MALLNVHDLPQIYSKPGARALLDTLSLLVSAPPSWDRKAKDETQTSALSGLTQVDPEGVTRYLTSIISSELQWIEDESVREQIWNSASARLSERSGRTAMGALSRQFWVPSKNGMVELTIHEPALTGDDLGLKTWAASYLLAKRLPTFDLVPPGSVRPQVLELGSGTGLVGLAMAVHGADVVLTDLPSIYENLQLNAANNAEIIHANGGSVRTGVLDWNNPASCTIPSGHTTTLDGKHLTARFPLILAADSLYSPDHPHMLVKTIETWLSEEADAKVIVEFPYRDAYLPEITRFREEMAKIHLRVLEEGEEKGYDDWSQACADDDGDDRALVTCWWSCWGRNAPTS